MVNFANVKAITLPEGPVSRVLLGSQVIWKKNPLPDGYTALSYIETTGTQYIATGFKPNQDSRVVMDFAITRTDVLNSVFGGRNTTTDNAFYFDAPNTGTWRFGYGDERTTVGACDTQRHRVDLNKNVLTLDGTVLATAPEATFTAGKAMYLGSIYAVKVYEGYVRIYSCKVYDNGTLIRDYVPCIHTDGEIGMYDKVNKVFYGNAGSGSFVAGR